MLVSTISSLFKVNQLRLNCSFMQVQCASLQTDDPLLFWSGINDQKADVTDLFRFCFIL